MSLCQYVLRPRRGLGQASQSLEAPRLQALETRDLFHQQNRKGKIVMTKTSRYKGLVLGSFLVPEIDMIFGDGVGASLVCKGQPAGMCDCSRSPSPFCSMIVPSIGTSIVTFKLICVRLQLHVSGASKPRLASSASAGNSGCSFRGNASSLITSLRPCIGSCSVCPVWG